MFNECIAHRKKVLSPRLESQTKSLKQAAGTSLLLFLALQAQAETLLGKVINVAERHHHRAGRPQRKGRGEILCQ